MLLSKFDESFTDQIFFSPWQREFEESFDYTETDDQLRCIAEIKADILPKK